MTREEIISGLQMTMDLFLFDQATGETMVPDMLNDLDRTTYDACKGAIEALKAQETHEKRTETHACDCISRQAAIDAVDKLSDEPIGYLEAAMDVLADLPSAEPEVIHCKDCRKRNTDGYCTVNVRNVHGLATAWWMPEDNDFCSLAERREE